MASDRASRLAAQIDGADRASRIAQQIESGDRAARLAAQIDAPEAEGPGLMRSFVAPLAASIGAGAATTAGATALMSGPPGWIAGLGLAALGGLAGGMAWRGTEEALTDEEYAKILDPESVAWDLGLGVAGGIVTRGVPAAYGAIKGARAVKNVAGAADEVASSLAPLAEAAPLAKLQELGGRFRESTSELRGDDLLDQATEVFQGTLGNKAAGVSKRGTRKVLRGLEKVLSKGAERPSLGQNDRTWGESIRAHLSRPWAALARHARQTEATDPAMARHMKNWSDAMWETDMWTGRFNKASEHRIQRIRELLRESPDVAANWKSHVEGLLPLPDDAKAREALIEWGHWVDELGDLKSAAKVISRDKGGIYREFEALDDYVPHTKARTGERSLGGAKSPTARGRTGGEAEWAEDFELLARRAKQRTVDEVVGASLFGGLPGAGSRSLVKNADLLEWQNEALRLLHARGQHEAAGHVERFIKKLHVFSSDPDAKVVRAMKDMASSVALTRAFGTQATELSKMFAFNEIRDGFAGTKLLRKPQMRGLLNGLRSTRSEILDTVGVEKFTGLDPRRAATGVDEGVRRVGARFAAGAVERVSRRAAMVVRGKMEANGALLRQAFEIVPTAKTREEAVRYLGQEFIDAGDEVTRAVASDGIDNLLARQYYNVGAGVTPDIAHPEGAMGAWGPFMTLYRTYGARAFGQFRDDILDPIRNGADASEKWLGWTRLMKATGFNYPPAVLNRALRTFADAPPEAQAEIFSRAVGDSLSSVGGGGGDAIAAAVDLMVNGRTDTLEQKTAIAPARDIFMRPARDIMSGDPGQMARGAMSVGQMVGAAAPPGSPLKAGTALGWVPRNLFPPD